MVWFFFSSYHGMHRGKNHLLHRKSGKLFRFILFYTCHDKAVSLSKVPIGIPDCMHKIKLSLFTWLLFVKIHVCKQISKQFVLYSKKKKSPYLFSILSWHLGPVQPSLQPKHPPSSALHLSPRQFSGQGVLQYDPYTPFLSQPVKIFKIFAQKIFFAGKAVQVHDKFNCMCMNNRVKMFNN